MNPQEIKLRTDTLSKNCLKVAMLLPKGEVISDLAKQELVLHAANLSIMARGLASAQAGRFFGQRVNGAVDHVYGCAYWLQLAIDEKWMDSSILMPLLNEADQLAIIFNLTAKNVESKLDHH
jgi:hypothetical protein